MPKTDISFTGVSGIRIKRRNRFLLILRSLHFEDMENQPRTQMGKIVPLVNIFNHRLQVIYYPAKELSIDESMMLWRGRLKFHQFIKGKRHVNVWYKVVRPL